MATQLRSLYLLVIVSIIILWLSVTSDYLGKNSVMIQHHKFALFLFSKLIITKFRVK